MQRKVIPYNPRLKDRARQLRKNMTRAEVVLWQHVKGKQLNGYDFDRQRPLDEFIVDFFCKELMLVIEIDGVTHDDEQGQIRDQFRQERLESLGVQFLRFQDEDVKQNLEGVLEAIKQWIKSGKPTPALRATPPGRGLN